MEQNISCAICNKVFDDKDRKPLFLPCGDTFCSICINLEFQLKHFFKCIGCQEVHQNLSINQLPVNKCILGLALKASTIQQKFICDCQKENAIHFFCKKDNKLCCFDCCFECFDHNQQILKIPDIMAEVMVLKEAIDTQIVQKALQLQNQINLLFESGQYKIIYGNQIQSLLQQAFDFLKGLSIIEFKTQFLQHMILPNKSNQQEIQKPALSQKQENDQKTTNKEAIQQKDQAQALKQETLKQSQNSLEIKPIIQQIQQIQQNVVKQQAVRFSKINSNNILKFSDQGRKISNTFKG